MTAVALTRAAPVRPLPLPLVLGLQEGWRIVRHPIAVVGGLLAVVLVLVGSDNGPRDAFETPVSGVTYFYGVLVYFAANLVASRDRRARSDELLAAVPSPPAARVAALCLGALLPALLSLGFVLAVHAMLLSRELYAAPALDATPTVWHLLQAPLAVLGGALLGIMVARLTAVPGVALLVMIAMILVDAWLAGKPDTIQPLATYVIWAQYGTGSAWAGHHPGSVPWHAAYLAALCAMAATGAFLREASDRRRVLLVGAAFSAVAVVTGVVQLP